MHDSIFRVQWKYNWRLLGLSIVQEYFCVSIAVSSDDENFLKCMVLPVTCRKDNVRFRSFLRTLALETVSTSSEAKVRFLKCALLMEETDLTSRKLQKKLWGNVGTYLRLLPKDWFFTFNQPCVGASETKIRIARCKNTRRPLTVTKSVQIRR